MNFQTKSWHIFSLDTQVLCKSPTIIICSALNRITNQSSAFVSFWTRHHPGGSTCVNSFAHPAGMAKGKRVMFLRRKQYPKNVHALSLNDEWHPVLLTTHHVVTAGLRRQPAGCGSTRDFLWVCVAIVEHVPATSLTARVFLCVHVSKCLINQMTHGRQILNYLNKLESCKLLCKQITLASY